MSVVNVAKESVSSWNAGNGSVGETPAQLSDTSFEVRKHVVIRADAGNSGTITVGPNAGGVSAGFILAAGEQTPPIYVDDLSKVWLVGSASGQNYSFICT
jgi:hypothetical protein